MTFKNLFLSLFGMLVVYHRAEMESPFKDITASCLLKHKMDDGLKGFSASRAVTESLVQLWSRNNCAASTSCAEPSQPWSGWVKGVGDCAGAESTVGTTSHRREPGLWVWAGDSSEGQGALSQATLHTCWLTLPSKTTDQRVVWK